MTKKLKKKTNFDEKITATMGSMPSILIHTVLFIIFLILPLVTQLTYESVLLILTTIVSLEAIYLALFIQISINRQAKTLDEVSDDIEDIQENVEDVSQDVEELNKSVDEIEKDVSEMQEDVEDIQEEVDDQHPENLSEEMEEQRRKDDQKNRLENMEKMLVQLILEVKQIKK